MDLKVHKDKNTGAPDNSYKNIQKKSYFLRTCPASSFSLLILWRSATLLLVLKSPSARRRKP